MSTNLQGNTPVDPEREQFIQTLRETLPSWTGKFVKVTMRRPKNADGETDVAGYYLVDYLGEILNPPLRTFPENNANGPICLYIQERSQMQRIYALALSAMEEIDDEVQPPRPMQVSMSALQQPQS